jgi:hypothetical protein
MGREERREALPRLLAHAPQHDVGGRNLARVVARLGGVVHAQLVGLGLVVAAVLEEQQSERLLRQPAVALEAVGQHGRHAETEARELLLRDLLRAVAGGDVAHLVAQHARKLRFGVEVSENAARDVDVPPRHGEGVHGRVVEQSEVPVELRDVRCRSHLPPNAVHVGREPGVVVSAVLPQDGLVALTADLQLLLLGHQRQFALARDRIEGTPGRHAERGESHHPH